MINLESDKITRRAKDKCLLHLSDSLVSYKLFKHKCVPKVGISVDTYFEYTKGLSDGIIIKTGDTDDYLDKMGIILNHIENDFKFDPLLFDSFKTISYEVDDSFKTICSHCLLYAYIFSGKYDSVATCVNNTKYNSELLVQLVTEESVTLSFNTIMEKCLFIVK